MIRLDDRQPVPDALRGSVIALGNFDGFHLGHQAVVGAAIDRAREQGMPAIVGTFDPHPMRFFKPDTQPFRLTTLDQRQDLFAAAGADAMLVFHFGAAMAAMPADDWIGAVLHGALGASAIVTGEDFTFGRGRTGSVRTLAELAARHGIAAHSVPAVSDSEGPISSSRIRGALRSGECAIARRLLTRPFAIRGIVQHGDKLGRTIGYPTANLPLGDYLRPRYGIYAITGTLPDGRVLQGAANVGIRPTFDPPKELLEAYLFDFAGDLYGAPIEVAFHHFLRPEAKFDSLDALTDQMARDCAQARELLAALAL